MWTIVELHMTIICTAIIACKPAISLLFSVAPFSSICFMWSRVRSNHFNKGFGCLSRFKSKEDPINNLKDIESPRSVQHLHKNSTAASITPQMAVVISTRTICVEPALGPTAGELSETTDFARPHSKTFEASLP